MRVSKLSTDSVEPVKTYSGAVLSETAPKSATAGRVLPENNEMKCTISRLKQGRSLERLLPITSVAVTLILRAKKDCRRTVTERLQGLDS